MTAWTIACNPSAYAVMGAFNKLSKINWKQSTNVEEGDIIYIYVGKPISGIRFKCEATKVNLERNDIDDSEFVLDGANYKNYGRYMELSLLETYDDIKYGLESLKENGLKAVQGPSRISDELSDYLNSMAINPDRERENAYPKDYVQELNITKNQWQELIMNPAVFTAKNISFMQRIYKSDNHKVTLYDLGIQDGISPSSYISPVVQLAKRISGELNLEPFYRKDGSQVWWVILFWGRYREDDRFEWKLRPELSEALASLYPELMESIDIDIDNKEDSHLVEDLRAADVEIATSFTYSKQPKAKVDPIIRLGHKIYLRDRKTSINALIHADYSCEVDEHHPTFIRKNSDKKYTEPHHLVPMAFSDYFDVSLDIEENIVSLCSNCHNQIHYGEGADTLLNKLYGERKDLLMSVGINISCDQLLELYG